jgi:VanZ family protein
VKTYLASSRFPSRRSLARRVPDSAHPWIIALLKRIIFCGFGLASTRNSLSFCAVVARFFKFWLPVLLWMVLVFSASTSLGAPRNTSRFVEPFLRWIAPNMSPETIHRIHYAIRKMAHFTEYCILGVLVLRLVRAEPALAGTALARQVRLALLLTALYACSDEFHQLFVPGRESAVRDVLIDTTGAAVGIGLCWLAVRARVRAA